MKRPYSWAATVFCFVAFATSATAAAIDDNETAVCDEKLSQSVVPEKLLFDEKRALKQIEAHGFGAISDLTLHGEGHWCGTASRYDITYEVRIDPRGNFYRDRLGGKSGG